MYEEEEKNAVAKYAQSQRLHNPTLRENIDQKIQYHLDEIDRLKKVAEKLPGLLDVNLRDLREAMNI